MKNPIHDVKILSVFLAAESVLLLCLLVVSILQTNAPPARTFLLCMRNRI